MGYGHPGGVAYARHVGEKDERISIERHRDVRGGGIGIDVEEASPPIGGDRGDRDDIAPLELR